MDEKDFANLITNIPDYPQPGIIFRDITTLFKDPQGFHDAVDVMCDYYKDMGITKVVGAEARGFMMGAPMAYKLGAGFVPARKPGKLPRETYGQEYALEYGTDELHIHKDAIDPDDIVLIVDDLVATGGTAVAEYKLVENFNAKIVGMCFMLELAYLNPREAIAKYTDTDVYSLIKID
ncbi:MAG: adenine phosphoribosyltransferase [Coriobacteriales bacterium]